VPRELALLRIDGDEPARDRAELECWVTHALSGVARLLDHHAAEIEELSIAARR